MGFCIQVGDSVAFVKRLLRQFWEALWWPLPEVAVVENLKGNLSKLLRQRQRERRQTKGFDG